MMNWEEVTALSTSFGVMGGAFIFIVRAVMATEIKKLNGTYLRTELANQKFEQIDKTFENIERHFDYLRDNKVPIEIKN